MSPRQEYSQIKNDDEEVTLVADDKNNLDAQVIEDEQPRDGVYEDMSEAMAENHVEAVIVDEKQASVAKLRRQNEIMKHELAQLAVKLDNFVKSAKPRK